jgi:hypothetical protein
MIDLSDLTQSERGYVMSFPADKRQAAAETLRKIKENARHNSRRRYAPEADLDAPAPEPEQERYP